MKKKTKNRAVKSDSSDLRNKNLDPVVKHAQILNHQSLGPRKKKQMTKSRLIILVNFQNMIFKGLEVMEAIME